jgi:hypothetical protein
MTRVQRDIHPSQCPHARLRKEILNFKGQFFLRLICRARKHCVGVWRHTALIGLCRFCKHHHISRKIESECSSIKYSYFFVNVFKHASLAELRGCFVFCAFLIPRIQWARIMLISLSNQREGNHAFINLCCCAWPTHQNQIRLSQVCQSCDIKITRVIGSYMDITKLQILHVTWIGYWWNEISKYMRKHCS